MSEQALEGVSVTLDRYREMRDMVRETRKGMRTGFRGMVRDEEGA